MKPSTGCKLFGGYRGAIGIKDSVVLLHSTIGCSWGTMAFHIPSRLNDIRQVSSVLYEDEIIYGGEEKLESAIKNVSETYKPSVIFVISGCVSEIMDDDVEGIIDNFGGEIPIIHIDGAGFKESMDLGFIKVMESLVHYMKFQEEKANSINLIGLSSDDYMIDADIMSIKNMLGDKVEINTIIPYDSFDNIMKAPDAALNVVLKGFESVGKLMKDKFDIPYVVVDYPYGIKASKDFINTISKHLCINYDNQLYKAEKVIKEKLERIFNYLHHIYGLPVAVNGDLVRGPALKFFLEQELGMDVEVYNEASCDADLNDFEENVINSNSVIIFGSSFERGLSYHMNIPLIKYIYPVFDSICISKKCYVGFEGVTYLVEDIINTLMNTDYKRGGLFE